MIILPPDNNFLAEDIGHFEDCKIAILSAPYEHTVSYGGGAGKGPEAIINASAYVEFYDDEFDRELCFEKGIATIEPIKFNGRIDKAALDLIEENVSSLLEKDKFVVTLGGEHTISTAPIAAHFKKYPDMSILHFDAHSDLRDSYEGNIYSHASFMARVAEFFPPERITQVGIRAQCREERQFIRDNSINTFFASEIRRGIYSENWQKEIVKTLGKNIYITFDLDYFDPAIMPATGTPEPDGFLYSETLDIFRDIATQGKNIIGFDVVELAPVDGLNHPDMLAARLVYKLLNFSFCKK